MNFLTVTRLLGCVCAVGILPGCIVIPIADLLQGVPLKEQVIDEGGGVFSKEKIAIIEVSGVIQGSEQSGLFSSTPDSVSEIKKRLDIAAADEEVKAVVLKISSPGGEVTACDMIHREVLRFRESESKPVVACIVDQGASGGYYIAVAAESIIVQPTAIVGSIGVILQSWNIGGLLEKVGIEVEPIKSGEIKDLNSLFRSKSDVERAVLQKIVDSMHQRFVTVIDNGRSSLTRDEILKFADGRVVSGGEAVSLKMADREGYLSDAVALAAERAGIEDPTIVRYARTGGVPANLYTQQAAPPLQASNELSLRWGMPQAAGPKLYYLWVP